MIKQNRVSLLYIRYIANVLGVISGSKLNWYMYTYQHITGFHLCQFTIGKQFT